MAEVAAAAGISPGAIYRYFENKEQLAQGCMDAKALAIEKQWGEPGEDSPDPLGAFNELARATFATLDEPGSRVDSQLAIDKMLLMSRPSGADELQDEIQMHVREAEVGIAQRLLTAQAKGQLPADLDIHTLAGALFSFYWGARLLRMVDPTLDTGAQFELVADFLSRVR
jgi:AcrR family transcriptional regulator